MRAVLRMALRGVRRRSVTNLVVGLLVALPVGIGVFVAVASRSGESTELDRYTAWFGDVPFAIDGGSMARRTSGDDAPSMASVVAALEDAGARLFVQRRFSADHPISASIVEIDLTDPAAETMVPGRSGAAAPASGEIALTKSLADALSVDVGDRLTTAPGKTVLVASVVRPHIDYDGPTIFVPPGTVDWSALSADRVSWRIGINELDRARIEAAIEPLQRGNRGIRLVEARADAAASPFDGWHDGYIDLGTRPEQFGMLITGLLLIESTLVAAAAFSVAARRRVTEFGRLSATGAGSREITSLMMAEAAIVATVGASVGAVVALLAAVWWPSGLGAVAYSVEGFSPVIDGPTLHLLDVVGPILLAVVAAVVAVLIPARRAARLDPQTARSGGDDWQPVPTSWLPIGCGLVVVSLLGIGWALSLADRGYGEEPGLIGLAATIGMVAGVVLAGSVLIDPLGAVVSGRLVGGRGTIRLALRQVVRHRARTVAVFAAMALLFGVGVLFATMLNSDGRWEEAATGSHWAIVASDPGGLETGGLEGWLDPADPEAGPPEPTSVMSGAESDPVTLLTSRSDTGFGETVTLAIDRPVAERIDPTGQLWKALDDGGTVSLAGLWYGDFFPARSSNPTDVRVFADGELLALDHRSVSLLLELPGLGVGRLVSVDEPDPTAGVTVEATSSILVFSADGFTEAEATALARSGATTVSGMVKAEQGVLGDVVPQLIVLTVLGVVAFAVYRLIAALVRVESAADLGIAAAIGGSPGLDRRIAAVQAAFQLGIAALVAIPLGLIVARLLFDQSVGPRFQVAWLVVAGLPILTVVVAGAVGATTFGTVSFAASRRPT